MERFLIKEGTSQIIIALCVTLFLMFFISDFLGYISLFITLTLVYIYRLPSINNIFTSKLVSPLSGELIAIDKVNNQVVLYINKNLCDASLLVAPQTSQIKVLEHKNGINLDANSFKAKKLNSFVKIKFDSLILEILVGKYNTLLNLEGNKKVSQYDKIGTLTHGSVKITLNSEFKTDLKVGQKLIIGETILA